jgi:hypothetical protein
MPWLERFQVLSWAVHGYPRSRIDTQHRRNDHLPSLGAAMEAPANPRFVAALSRSYTHRSASSFGAGPDSAPSKAAEESKKLRDFGGN